MARHESLRTVYPENDGASYQHILDAEKARPELMVTEISEAELADKLAKAVRYRFELAAETSLRAELFAGRSRVCPAVAAASYRWRRLVAYPVDAGSIGCLRGKVPGECTDMDSVTGTICGLCHVAAEAVWPLGRREQPD